MEVINHIEIRDGQAVISGHGHLKAKMVARKYLWEGLSVEAVMDHYGLTAAEVHAAIAFYLDNREKLDAEYDAAVQAAAVDALTLDELRAAKPSQAPE